MYVNGELVYEFNSSFSGSFTNTDAYFTVGQRRRDDNNQWRMLPGDINEVIYFNRALSDNEMVAINKYLNDKWGLFSDSDSDGVTDGQDAFPNDPAASIDSDSDGYPDAWHIGMNEDNSTSDPALILDAFPSDADKYLPEFRILSPADNGFVAYTGSTAPIQIKHTLGEGFSGQIRYKIDDPFPESGRAGGTLVSGTPKEFSVSVEPNTDYNIYVALADRNGYLLTSNAVVSANFSMADDGEASGDNLLPLTIDGLEFWVDASQEDTMTFNGERVAEWRSLTADGAKAYHNTNSHRSKLEVVQDDRKGMRLDSTYRGFHLRNKSGGDFKVNKPYTVITVYSSFSTSSSGRRTVQGSNNWLVGPYGNRHSYHADGWVHYGTYHDQNQPVVATAMTDSSGSKFYLDSVLKGSSSSYRGEPNHFYIGNVGGHGETSYTHLYDLLIFNKVLSDEDREAVENYLLSKWEIGDGGSGASSGATALAESTIIEDGLTHTVITSLNVGENNLYVGRVSEGTLRVNDAVSVSANYVYVGHREGGSGTVYVQDNDAVFVASKNLTIAGSGTAVMNHSAGTVHVGETLHIGRYAGSNGSYALTGGILKARRIHKGSRRASFSFTNG
jgi:hypothetical protein